MPHILIVDDDKEMLATLKDLLVEEGCLVSTVTNGPETLELIARKLPDLVVLDIMMPEMDGIEVCRRIRTNPFSAKLPVIFLTAKGHPGDVVTGLDAGGDDYIVKPFQVIELPARIRALLRRVPEAPLDPASDRISYGGLQLSTQRFEVTIGDQVIDLRPMEHRLLHCLMIRRGQPVSVEQLLEEVWDYPPGVGDPHLVRVHIANLRAKIETSPGEPRYIQNMRGHGYLIGS